MSPQGESDVPASTEGQTKTLPSGSLAIAFGALEPRPRHRLRRLHLSNHLGSYPGRMVKSCGGANTTLAL